MAQKLASAPTRMIVLSAFAMMLLGPSQASAGVFTPIPGPQNSFTGPYGINDSGAISGTYGHSPGTQGFIEKSGVFTAVNFTGNPIDTQLFGINNSGVAVGYSRFANGDIDFVYDHGQFSQPFPTNFLPFGINDHGDIVGITPGVNFQGFTYIGGVTAGLSFPGSLITSLTDINNTGTIVGSEEDAKQRFHGFIYDHGVFSTLDVPGADQTKVYGINDHGDIVGVYFIGADGHGFLYDNSVFTPIDVPGASFTEAHGINNSDEITLVSSLGGYLYTTSGVAGVPELGTWAMMIIGFGGVGWRLRRRRGPVSLIA